MTTRKYAEEARTLVEGGAAITLDGKAAGVSGYMKPFATVWDRTDHIRAGEWAWDTVVRVLKNGGAFKS